MSCFTSSHRLCVLRQDCAFASRTDKCALCVSAFHPHPPPPSKALPSKTRLCCGAQLSPNRASSPAADRKIWVWMLMCALHHNVLGVARCPWPTPGEDSGAGVGTKTCELRRWAAGSTWDARNLYPCGCLATPPIWDVIHTGAAGQVHLWWDVLGTAASSCWYTV
jgi:hypothetical protein